MEELRLLVDMVAHLPQMALWVIALFFAYKVCIIGSIYGVIRFCVEKLHLWAMKPKHELKEIRPMLDGVCISRDGTVDALIAQLYRLRGKGLGIESEYIHTRSVDWLREAIDDRIAKDAQKKAA